MEVKKKEIVQSLTEFLEVLFERTSKYKNYKIWFRGENSDSYKLVPNIYRRKGKEVTYCHIKVDSKIFYALEQNIDSSFYRKAFQFFSANGIENNRWNRYFLKQHYGIKTRLLDWTENALIALFFALSNDHQSNINARIWILLPFELNNYSIQKLFKQQKKFKKILSLEDFDNTDELMNNKDEISLKGLGRKYYTMNTDDDEELYPIAIYPPHLDSRMAAQQSCFTLFGNMSNGLQNDDLSDPFLNYIDIAAEKKPKVLQELKVIGISSYSVFPDLDGLGKDINVDSSYDLEISQNNSDWKAFFNQKP